MRAIIWSSLVISVLAACSFGHGDLQARAQASEGSGWDAGESSGEDAGWGSGEDAAVIADASPDADAGSGWDAGVDADGGADAGGGDPPPDPTTGITPLPGAPAGSPPGTWGKWKVPTPTGDVYGGVTHCWFEDDGINIALPGGHVALAFNFGDCDNPGGFMGIDSGAFGERCVCDPAQPSVTNCTKPEYIMETTPDPANNIHEHEGGYGKPLIIHCGQNKQCVSVAHTVVVMHPSAGGPHLVDLRSARCI